METLKKKRKLTQHLRVKMLKVWLKRGWGKDLGLETQVHSIRTNKHNDLVLMDRENLHQAKRKDLKRKHLKKNRLLDQDLISMRETGEKIKDFKELHLLRVQKQQGFKSDNRLRLCSKKRQNVQIVGLIVLMLTYGLFNLLESKISSYT